MAIFSGGLFSKRRELESFFVNSYGNNQTRGIFTFTIDINSGELFFKNHFKTPTDPIYSFNYGRFVCTTYKNRTGTKSDGGICSYASTAMTLALVSRLSNEGKTYMHASTNGDSTTATKVFGADYYNGEVMVGLINKKKLVKKLNVHKFVGGSVHPTRQLQPHPHHVGMTPDQQLYVVCLGLDKVFVFDVSEDGQLIEDESASFTLKPGNGPRSMEFSEDQKTAYVVNELANTIDVYSYANKKFELIQTIDTYNKEVEEESLASQLIITQDQQFVIVGNRGHDCITLFKRLEDGSLEYRDEIETASGPRTMEIFRDRFIVVGCQRGGLIEVIELSRQKDGLLFETNHSYGINEPVCIRKFNDITERKN